MVHICTSSGARYRAFYRLVMRGVTNDIHYACEGVIEEEPMLLNLQRSYHDSITVVRLNLKTGVVTKTIKTCKFCATCILFWFPNEVNSSTSLPEYFACKLERKRMEATQMSLKEGSILSP